MGNAQVSNIAWRTTEEWRSLCTGLVGRVQALAVTNDGAMVVSGRIQATPTGPATRLARIDQSGTWGTMGNYFSSAVLPLWAYPTAMRTLDNGDVLAFLKFSDFALDRVVRWDGASWHEMPSPGISEVRQFLVLSSGNIVALGFNEINYSQTAQLRVWNGTTWAVLSPGSLPGSTDWSSLSNGVAMPDGSFVYGGYGVGAPLQRLWPDRREVVVTSVSLGTYISSVARDATGNFIVGGNFQSIEGMAIDNIARWNGAAWVTMGDGLNGNVSVLTTLTTGEVIASGLFTASGNTPMRHIARWDGVRWHAVGEGLDAPATHLEALPDGGVAVVGEFKVAGGMASPSVARWVRRCTGCDDIDFNNNEAFPEDQDVIDFFSVLAGGACSTGACNDIDFNNNGVFPEDQDVIDFFNVLAGGGCP
jgi:trimeric autotransporter adhesin